jgi:DNA-binding MarR family transcriptional regulator
MQELARFLDLDKSSVTGLVDRAEKRGLVQRAPSTDDRRAIRVKLTPVGRRAGQTLVNQFQADIARITECLSAAETKELSTLATRIIERHVPEG